MSTRKRAPNPKPTTPPGDARHHLARAALISGLSAAVSPSDGGALKLLVARQPNHARMTPAHTTVSVDLALPGDRWSIDNKAGVHSQLSVMNTRVAELICNGQALTLPGDNLLLDLDLSEANLPIGSQLRLGSSLLEVTPKAHTGCKHFAQRFGKVARKLTQEPKFVPMRLRGLFLCVIEPGELRVGDVARVVRRGY